MNAQNAHEYLPLVQALADGKTIQCRYQIDDDWYEESEINFGWPLECYRIKPEPRTFEIVRSKLSCGSIYNEETWDGSNPDIWERITVMEVLK
jgi:hypothetical protein